MEEDVMQRLPMDIIDKILWHLSDPASLARLASTCKFWRNHIKDPSFLDRLKNRRHCHRFTPSLLLGFFHQHITESRRRTRKHHRNKLSCLAPSFTPISELSRLVGGGGIAAEPASLGNFIQGLGAELNFYEPVASQDGFLALRRRPTAGRSQRDQLCVCNPITGDVFPVPPLTPEPPPDQYVLLVAEEIGHNGHTSQSFQLVAFWIRRGRFVNGVYGSKTRKWTFHWGAPEEMSGLHVLPSPAAASRGAVHFLCGSRKNWRLTQLTSLEVDTQEPSYLQLPPDARRAPLIATYADGELLLLYLKGLRLVLWKHDSGVSRWILAAAIDLTGSLQAVRRRAGAAEVTLEMLGGRSGAVVLSVEGEGRFVLSLGDRSMRRIESEQGRKKHRRRCPCPYEIDWLSCIAITGLGVDGSLSRDVGRMKIQGRWRRLVATGKAYE